MSSLPSTERSRSPRYPSHSLEQALEFVRRLYEGVHRSAVDSLTAVKLMGFAGRSGASATALGSVRQYGLIDGVGDRTRVSDLALSILEPGSPEELASSVVQASKQPLVFGKILERFEGRLPSANEPVRAYLIRELGFSKRGADECLSSLRETQSFVQSFDVPQSASAAAERPETGYALTVHPAVSASEATHVSLGSSHATPTSESELIVIPLTKDCRVEMRFDGEMTKRAIDKLLRILELMKEDSAEG
jgi:hypothetical protein